MLAIFNAYSRILQWFEASWSSLFAQFCVVMYCCVLMNLFMFSASAHFMDPAGSTWFVQILIRILGPKVSSILLCDFFSSFPQQVATSLAVPHSTMVAFLNSSVFHGTSVPCKYRMITWWYKMTGKISRLPVGFHFWRGEARVFSAGCCSDGCGQGLHPSFTAPKVIGFA